MSELGRDALIQRAEEAFDELQAWCEAHSGYRLLELEEQALVIRQRLMGQMMSSLVAQREAGLSAGGVTCAKCGGKLEDRGQQSRTVQGPEGAVELRRRYYYCSSCKEGFFPSGSSAGTDPTTLERGGREGHGAAGGIDSFLPAGNRDLPRTGGPERIGLDAGGDHDGGGPAAAGSRSEGGAGKHSLAGQGSGVFGGSSEWKAGAGATRSFVHLDRWDDGQHPGRLA